MGWRILRNVTVTKNYNIPGDPAGPILLPQLSPGTSPTGQRDPTRASHNNASPHITATTAHLANSALLGLRRCARKARGW